MSTVAGRGPLPVVASIAELLAQNALIQAVAGIEQHLHGDAVIHLDADRADRPHFVVVGDGGNRAFSGSSTSTRTRAVSGRSAPRHRRGRNGLIGVSAISGAVIGMIGPWTERL